MEKPRLWPPKLCFRMFQNTTDTGMTRLQPSWDAQWLGSPAQPGNLPARCWRFARPNPSANHLPGVASAWSPSNLWKHSEKNPEYCMILYESKTFNNSSRSFSPLPSRFPLMVESFFASSHPGLITQGSNRSTEEARDLEIFIATVLQQLHQRPRRPRPGCGAAARPTLLDVLRSFIDDVFMEKMWGKWSESMGLGRMVPVWGHVLGVERTGLAQPFNFTTLNGAPNNGSWSIWTWPEIIHKDITFSNTCWINTNAIQVSTVPRGQCEPVPFTDNKWGCLRSRVTKVGFGLSAWSDCPRHGLCWKTTLSLWFALSILEHLVLTCEIWWETKQ